MSWLLTHVVLLLGFLLALPVIAQMIRQRYSPAGSLAWLLSIILIPYLGIPLFLMLGGRKMRSLAASKTNLQLPEQSLTLQKGIPDIDRLMRSYGLPGAVTGNQLQLLGSGEEGYAALVEIIEQATTHLWVSTFILHPDQVGRDIIDRLSRRAAAGVEVRVLLDGVGSLHTHRKDLAPLTAAGGKIAFFMPVMHRPFRGRTNLRNHRKSVIADSCRIWAGGTNIANEYIGPTYDPHRWRDLSFILEGPATQHYIDIFSSDWQFATGKQLSGSTINPAKMNVPVIGDATVQVVPSGPDVSGDPLYSALISAAFQATERLWIVTPYFIPDAALAQALQLAVHRGVDVRVILPEISNHKFADMARGPYLRELQQVGGQVLLYQGGMLHGKALLADTFLAVIGSANFDMRSLFLNYETGLLLYSQTEVKQIEAWIEDLTCHCRHGIGQAGLFRDLLEGIIRMMAPML
ncbi:phospholipase D-like domain-containing protein [Desulfuromusa kysingii]|nr:phospholipase D-like domain-containing protein [Desulfuromusa kysingii]